MYKMRVVVGTTYAGDPIIYEYKGIEQTDIGDFCEKSCEDAFEKYAALPDNADVPAAELYASISPIEIDVVHL